MSEDIVYAIAAVLAVIFGGITILAEEFRRQLPDRSTAG